MYLKPYIVQKIKNICNLDILAAFFNKPMLTVVYIKQKSNGSDKLLLFYSVVLRMVKTDYRLLLRLIMRKSLLYFNQIQNKKVQNHNFFSVHELLLNYKA